MADLGRNVQHESGAVTSGDEGPPKDQDQDRSRTAGTDRDYDESQEAANQGHGHPRSEPKRADESGRSEERVTDADREQRDLGGPGG